MPRRRQEERVYGPYYRKARDDWRIVHRSADGTDTAFHYPSKREAEEARRDLEREIALEALTTTSAADEFLAAKRAEGCTDSTVDTYRYALRRFFPEDMALTLITERWCQQRYDELRTELANDSHRNYLAQAKIFGRWCVKRRLLS
ncbi:MAG: hypothetical protein AAGC55_10640, partial [Myxococcota bacterium]